MGSQKKCYLPTCSGKQLPAKKLIRNQGSALCLSSRNATAPIAQQSVSSGQDKSHCIVIRILFGWQSFRKANILWGVSYSRALERASLCRHLAALLMRSIRHTSTSRHHDLTLLCSCCRTSKGIQRDAHAKLQLSTQESSQFKFNFCN